MPQSNHLGFQYSQAKSSEPFLAEHAAATRRFFLKLAALGTVSSLVPGRPLSADELPALLAGAIEKIEPYFTAQDDFRDVSRGKPTPHRLPDEKKAEVGITRDTWSLEFGSDTDNPADLKRPYGEETGTTFRFDDLMKMAEKHAVRFPKVMTCLNIGCPLGMGVWEGVPLREVFWQTQPRQNIRRLFYYGYHNDDPKQMFRSSLPIDRILEDPDGVPPVILCYKLNGEFLTPARGGPVRVVVPEAYGFKSIKWLTHMFASNLFYANDTYGEKNNDVHSQLKSFAATLSVPPIILPERPVPITGYAQSGITGLSKVQVWVESDEAPYKGSDQYFRDAPWVDATVLDPPAKWGEGLGDPAILQTTSGFDNQGQPQTWPMRLAKAHWAALLPPMKPGDYTIRSRTVDERGRAQPMPRPFQKSGHAAIESVPITVETA
jgi:DMSO/TMAO reductase YedYZ molybdopterin-dependent catalytic subunit